MSTLDTLPAQAVAYIDEMIEIARRHGEAAPVSDDARVDAINQVEEAIRQMQRAAAASA